MMGEGVWGFISGHQLGGKMLNQNYLSPVFFFLAFYTERKTKLLTCFVVIQAHNRTDHDDDDFDSPAKGLQGYTERNTPGAVAVEKVENLCIKHTYHEN